MSAAGIAVGTLLGGTYRLERELGQGGMGVVYEASHRRLSRRFAVKVLRPTMQSQADLLRRFQREAEITSRLGHPHIVEVVDFDHPADTPPYIVMELLDGEDLTDRLRREGPMSLQQCATILRQTCSALHAAHEGGVVHRDLKPRNIFLARRGGYRDYVKVLDFGISKVLGAQVELTVEQLVIGTPGYMAPEQATGRSSQVDRRTDIFALGAILYRMLAGRPPFSADSQPATLYRIVHEAPTSLAELRPDLSHEVVEAVERALRKDPAERYPTMQELWTAFAGAAQVDIAESESEWEVPTEDRSFGAPPDTLVDVSLAGQADAPAALTLHPQPTRQMDPPRRRWLLAVPLLIIAGAGGLLLWRGNRHPLPAPSPARADAGNRAPTRPTAKQNGDPDGGAPPGRRSVAAPTTPASRPAKPSRRTPGTRRGPAARIRHASLHVVTSVDERPIWAEISVDGKPVGKSPVSIPRLLPGTHQVVVQREGYRREARRVRLRRGKRRVLLVKLKRATGDLQ